MKTISAALAVTLTVLCTEAGRARAEGIGVASEVVRTVLASEGSEFVPLGTGDAVFRDQRIRSGRDGSALLTLADASVVAVGPSSELVLDEFVAPGGVRSVSIARGVFRFISGPAGQGTHYIVRTPHASIAVRGTTFDVRVLDGMTTVVLHEGAVDVCRQSACRSIKPGASVDVTPAGIYPAAIDRNVRWTFLSNGDATRRRLAAEAATSAAEARLSVEVTRAASLASSPVLRQERSGNANPVVAPARQAVAAAAPAPAPAPAQGPAAPADAGTPPRPASATAAVTTFRMKAD
jgi:hypothetical protein